MRVGISLCALLIALCAASDPADTGDDVADYDEKEDDTHHAAAHWTYFGRYGFANWSKTYNNCALNSQSPIDIVTSDVKLDEQLNEIILSVSPGNQTVAENNGHTVNLVLGPQIRVSGVKPDSSYRVAGVHFHWGRTDSDGSEHTVNSKHYPLEMHVVSYDEEKYDSVADAAHQPEGLAVIGLLFQVTTVDNTAMTPLTNVLNQLTQTESHATVNQFDVTKVLPSRITDYYRYSGSLTTPPCYQSVIWTVLRDVRNISKSQLESFRNLLQEKSAGGVDMKLDYNWRPTQGLNGRVVSSSFINRPPLNAPAPDDTAKPTGQAVKLTLSHISLLATLFAALNIILYSHRQ